MTPTFTKEDVHRISAHLSMTPEAFRKKWLYKDTDGDWMNKARPCQFFNTEDFKCSIYEVRPEDCAGFPHLTKRKTLDYIHVYKQNVEYCPATQRWVEHLEGMITGKKVPPATPLELRQP
jgi:Fe-S-cluster containining protein